jgi:hypothetical protein
MGLVERIGSQIDLGFEGIDERVDPVARPARRRTGVDDEVAIRADRCAEGDVDVESDRRRRQTTTALLSDPEAPIATR